jgi:hypothetical protein
MTCCAACWQLGRHAARPSGTGRFRQESARHVNRRSIWRMHAWRIKLRSACRQSARIQHPELPMNQHCHARTAAHKRFRPHARADAVPSARRCGRRAASWPSGLTARLPRRGGWRRSWAGRGSMLRGSLRSCAREQRWGPLLLRHRRAGIAAGMRLTSWCQVLLVLRQQRVTAARLRADVWVCLSSTSSPAPPLPSSPAPPLPRSPAHCPRTVWQISARRLVPLLVPYTPTKRRPRAGVAAWT